MTGAADCPTLIAYPQLVWDVACAKYPPGPGYSWQAHLRELCKVARRVHQEQPVALKCAGEAERMHVWALSDVNPEMLVLDVLRSIASHPDSALWQREPLWWLNPYDPHLQPKSMKSRSPVGQSRRGTHI
jgi:hypothetical protein